MKLIIGGELVLHGDVGDMWGDGSGFTSHDVLEALAELGPKDITVRLNSGGGFVWDGVAIYNSLLAHAGKVTMMIDGIAASAASVIAMAGSKIVMGDGAQMMIHDPSAITWGTASDHQQSADALNRLGDQMAAVYAGRTGKTTDEMRTLMLAETWFSAEEAINAGLADETVAPAEKIAATAKAGVTKFDYHLYKRAPAFVMSVGQRPLPPKPERTAQMLTKEEQAALDAAAAIKAAEKAAADKAIADATATATAKAVADATNGAKAILDRCKVAKLSLEDAQDILVKSEGSIDKAQTMIIDAIVKRDEQAQVGTQPPVTVTMDARDKQLKGVSLSLMHKSGMKGGERNEFSGMTMREIAKHCLMLGGARNIPTDPMAMVKMAMEFRPSMSTGYNSTSDFSTVLADVAHKSMLKGFEENEETYPLFTAKGTLSDFKIARRVDLGLFPNLTEVPEGAEYKSATLSDRGTTIQLATYGKMFAITRQAIINDDLSVFTKVPSRMGRASKRTIGNLVWALITANGDMPDGIDLFHADHNNLAGAGAPSVTTLDAGRAAMALQTDPDGIAEGGLNIRPAFFLVPVELEGSAKVLMTSEFNPAATQRVPNNVRGLATVISDARLSTNSATKWYLAADPNTIDTIEVAYLNGVDTPVMEQQDGWRVDGVEFKIRLDAGVQVLDYRGLYRNG